MITMNSIDMVNVVVTTLVITLILMIGVVVITLFMTICAKI